MYSPLPHTPVQSPRDHHSDLRQSSSIIREGGRKTCGVGCRGFAVEIKAFYMKRNMHYKIEICNKKMYTTKIGTCILRKKNMHTRRSLILTYLCFSVLQLLQTLFLMIVYFLFSLIICFLLNYEVTMKRSKREKKVWSNQSYIYLCLTLYMFVFNRMYIFV